MNPHLFSLIFIAGLAISFSLRCLLALRQRNHVLDHRSAVPERFASAISLEDHQKAADYTRAKIHLALQELAADLVLLLALTLGGGLQLIHDLLAQALTVGGYGHGLALFAALGVVSFFVGLPFTLYRVFRLEAQFGFNRTTPSLFIADSAKGTLLTVLIGGPMLLAVLWLMDAMGSQWWLYVWLFWLTFNLVAMLVYPTVIAPLFNRFTPLTDDELRQRIGRLLARCGFSPAGLFVMDGSRRSSHGNAYFTGFGASRRIVFFDTLLERLSGDQIEAVLAHELGHFRHRHLWKGFALTASLGLAFLWLLGQLMTETWFFAGLGLQQGGTALALILFSLVVPVFLFPLSPLLSMFSRKHEYEADAYAAKHARAEDLVQALIRLYRDNAATLTPDPLHSLFYDSHPPAALRIARLDRA